jgi:hypothetical protein
MVEDLEPSVGSDFINNPSDLRSIAEGRQVQEPSLSRVVAVLLGEDARAPAWAGWVDRHRHRMPCPVLAAVRAYDNLSWTSSGHVPSIAGFTAGNVSLYAVEVIVVVVILFFPRVASASGGATTRANTSKATTSTEARTAR